MRALGGRQSIVLDAVALTLCTAGLVPVLLASFSEARPALVTQASQPEIGRLSRRFRDVRRRAGSALVWNEIAAGESIRRDDAIYVGGDSAAQVLLHDGARIDIDESSLVILKLDSPPDATAPATTSVALVRGSASPTAGEGRLALRVGASTVALSRGSRAEVRVREDRTARIDVTQGNAELVTPDGKRAAIGQRQRGTTDGRVRDLQIELTAPAPGERIIFTGPAARVPFAWHPRLGDAPYDFEISDDAELNHIIARGRTSESRWVQGDLGAGLYYWRVRRSTAQGDEISGERRLMLLEDRAAVPYAPAVDADIDRRDGQPILLAWSVVDGVSTYQLQVTAQGSTAPPIIDTEVSRPSFTIERPLEAGRYCYRVRAVEEGRKAWSSRRCFRVALAPLLLAPEPIKHGREVIPGGLPKEPEGSWLFYLIGSVAHAAPRPESAIVLRWRAIPGAVAYLVEIAEDKTFEMRVVSERVTDLYFRWRTVTQRSYYWRVRGIDAAGREGAASAPIRIAAELSAPTLLEPADGRAYPRATAPPQVALAWESSDLVREYVVEITTDPSFPTDGTLHETVTAAHHFVTPTVLGTHYWRITSIDLTGQPTSPSAVGRFEVFAATPVLLGPPEGEPFVWQSEELAVPIRWSPRPVQGFEIQASTDPLLVKGVVTSTSSEPSTQLIPPAVGTIHWRVRGLVPPTAWSPVSSFRVLPAVPIPLAPEDGARIEFEGESTEVELSYSPVPRMTGYEVEIAKVWTDAEEPLRVERTQSTLVRFSGSSAGRYIWVVRAVQGDVYGEFSAPRTFELIPRPVTEPADPQSLPPEEPPPSPPAASPPAPSVAAPAPPPSVASSGDPSGPVLFLGPRVGFLINFGAVVAPRFGATLVYRLPVLDRAMAVALTADYSVATASLSDAAGIVSFRSELHSVPMELIGSYTVETPVADLSFGAGLALVVSYISLASPAHPPLAQISVDGGAVAAIEAALDIGPGRAFVAISFALTSGNGGLVGENNPGGFLMGAGYRFGIGTPQTTTSADP